MGLQNNSSQQSPKYFHRLSKSFEFAVSEWVLMLLLFIDACFTYLIAKFASYCHLQGPCALCSRYDHVLAKDKTGIYWESFCNHHKSEISSLIISHVSGICEKCVSSVATKTKNKDKFNDETFQLLIGTTGSGPLQTYDSTRSKACFCCNEPLVSRDYVKNLLPTKSTHPHAPESIITKIEHTKNEKNIFVDESRECPHIVTDLATIATGDIDEKSCQNDENVEDTSRVNEPVSFDEVSASNDIKIPADIFLNTINPPKTNEVVKDPATTNGHQLPNQLELGDAYKLAISTKARQLSGKFLDQKSFNNSSTRISEDLKTLLSHRSNDSLISPKLSLNSDELTGFQLLQSRISLERNESNISIDGSVVSEIEGESVVDRLRRQVEHDKKLMGVLYKELEEERNASAVAANQAMAMITRLQEEKSALYTEALQSLRMMEEQAEYDNEALQNANDIIEEKDKQIQDLEERLRKTSEDV